MVKSDFYTKLKKLDIQEGKKVKLFADHGTQVCEAHNPVIVSFLQQMQGGRRPITEGSRENIRHNVHAWGDRGGTHACKLSKLGPVEWWWNQDGKLGIAIQDPTPRVRKTDTLVLYLFVLHSVTCLKICHFAACFTILWTSISVFILKHVTSSRFCLYLLNMYHFTYTFSHAHTEAHTHKHTCTISTQEKWRQPGTGAWLREAGERLC